MQLVCTGNELPTRSFEVLPRSPRVEVLNDRSQFQVRLVKEILD